MGYDGWLEYNGTELVNLSRTAQLCDEMGIEASWVDPNSVAWVQSAMLGIGYSNVASAPWYDAGVPASAEFAGIIPMALTGLDDSSRESVTIEYISDGGSSGKARNKTKPLVANFALMATTQRGATYGKRWLDRVLSSAGARTFCAGSDLRYFAYEQGDGEPVPEQMHMRDVSLTRGTSVTRKWSNHCSAVWMLTFTLTANDPFEYGDPVPQFTGLGGVVSGPDVGSSGSDAFVEQECPVYDYSPIYDPLHPALVAPPSAPTFYPAGWDLLPGVTMDRFWVRVGPTEPSVVGLVPMVTLTTDEPARMVRVSIWPQVSAPDVICDPLWTATVTYLPAGMAFIIDGEQKASYLWDGISASVRRTDSLVYGAGALPMQWDSFNDEDGLLITLDIMTEGSGDYDGGGTVRAALTLVPKSD